MALETLLRKSNVVQKNILFSKPTISNKLSNDFKILNTTASFSRNYKKLVFKKLEWSEHNFNISFITIIITKTFIIIIIAIIVVIIIIT